MWGFHRKLPSVPSPLPHGPKWTQYTHAGTSHALEPLTLHTPVPSTLKKEVRDSEIPRSPYLSFCLIHALQSGRNHVNHCF